MRNSLLKFSKADDGAIAPLFGLCILSLMIMSGIAVDGARSYRVASEAGIALDAAALASAKALRLEKPDDAQLQDYANSYFSTNFDASNHGEATYSSVSVAADRKLNKVTLNVTLQVPTTLTAILGRRHLDVVSRSSAIYDARDVELSMMLDVSGSMAGSKIGDLKAASSDLVTILLDGNKKGSKHKIAIAPFSTAVNIGAYAEEIVDKKDQKGKPYVGKGTTCVTDRFGAHAFKDKSPNSGKFGQRSAACPTTPVKPLSDDAEDLIAHIDSMSADGWTAGHLGIAWAWYLLSPEWADLWPGESEPKDYDDDEYTKVAILMTDGQFNNFYEPDNGASEAQARKLCDNMKSSGLTVYTVGFQVPDEALPILQYCATSPTHFFDAKDGTQLRDTFQTIAKRLAGLRLES